MIKATYRKLKAIVWIGGAVTVSVIVVGWLQMLPIGLLMLILILFGFPAAIARWVLRDQDFEELPD